MPELKKKILFITLIVAGICLALFCWLFLYLLKEISLQETGETVMWRDGGVYAIHSQTLLQDIHQGHKNIFKFLPDGELTVRTDLGLPPIRWTSKDYVLIADQFNEFVSGESLSGWKFHAMFYSMNCEDFQYGFQGASFDIVKYTTPNTRIERSIWVYPFEDHIAWKETAYEDEYSYASFDLSQISISPEEAMEIAEDQGGRAFRVSENNDCKIGLRIIAGIRDGNWQATYDTGETEYVIDINKETGEYKIVEP
ncbi:MAG: hypothetical protein HYZ22_05145 [Chloroflexi bacterium]|nr:hypothetical protein [Chloroflexota bacterium]